MHEPVGILIDILVAIAVMFVIPMKLNTNMAEQIADIHVNRAVESFEETVCANGCIDSNVYDAFLEKLNIAGPGRHVDIICRTTVWEPVYDENIFTGEVISYERESGIEEVLDIMYEKGKYNLRNNDTVEVTVWDDKGNLVLSTGKVRGRRKE